MLEAGLTHPIFVGGYYKSGTSLLRSMIGRHTRIAAGLETYWFDIEIPSQKTVCVDEKIERVRKFYGIDTREMATIVDQASNGPDFLSRVMELYTRNNEKQRWLEKTPGNIKYLNTIFQYWPLGKFIHIVRSPFDVYISQTQAKKCRSPEDFAIQWTSFFKPFIKHLENVKLTSNEILHLRYEHLVSNPKEIMRCVIDFLGETWEEGLEKFEGQSQDYKLVKAITGKESTSLLTLSSPLTKCRIGVSKNRISNSDKMVIEKFIDDEHLFWLFKGLDYQSRVTLKDLFEQ